MIKFGVTERGDASCDFSWINRINEMNGAILITKNITNTFINEVIKYNNIIVHATCTGYGGTIVEPNVPEFNKQLAQAKKLADLIGLDKVVIRVDPIIPTPKGITRAEKVILKAIELGFKRFRVSLIDMYPHVRMRMKLAGLIPPYGDNFYPSVEQTIATNIMLTNIIKKFGVVIESCAEPGLDVERVGCVSAKDFKILNITESAIGNSNQRRNCLCCSAKTELLNTKARCPHKCIYCYWKD